MKAKQLALGAALAVATVVGAACSNDSPSGVSGEGSGTIIVKLTDAPGLTDSVKSVDIFVVRVDARTSDADSAASDKNLSSDDSFSNGWRALATPNASYNLLALQNGLATTLGEAAVPAGTYNGLRLII